MSGYNQIELDKALVNLENLLILLEEIHRMSLEEHNFNLRYPEFEEEIGLCKIAIDNVKNVKFNLLNKDI